MQRFSSFFFSPAWLLLAWLLAPQPSAATSYVMVPDEDLADRSPIIAEVQVMAVDNALGTGTPETHYSMAVENLIHGEIDASPLTVRVLGGELPSGVGLEIHGAPRFATGDRALLFLLPRQDGTFAIRHFMLGAFHLVEAGDRKIAVRRMAEAEEIVIPGKATVRRGPRDLDRFRTWLEDREQGIERDADYFLDASDPALVNLSQKFSLIGNPPARFREFDTGGSVRFRSHSSGQPGLASGGVPEFQSALGVWRADPNTPINIFYGGTTNATGGLQNFDNINAILFDDPNGEFDEPFNCTSGGTVAFAGPWFSTNPADNHTYNGTTFRTSVGADLVTNAGLDCLFGGVPWIAQEQNAPETFAHELGHTLGLGHSCDDPGLPACTGALDAALMRPFLHGNNFGARLGSDDQAGIRFVYGEPVVVTPPANPSNLVANALSATQIRLTWNDNSNDETSFEIERRSGGGGFQALTTTSANIETYQDNSAQPDTQYTYRVRARNSAGTSNYSNEASATTLSLEPCEPSDTVLCLNGGRFKVEVGWQTVGGLEGPGTDAGLVSADSGLMWFFDANNLEMLIKVLNGCTINDHFWVFAAATTDVQYDLVVTDTFTGQSKTYLNAQGIASPAVTDTGAFATCDVVPPTSAHQPPSAARATPVTPSALAGSLPNKQGACVATSNRLCLNGGRFAVEIDWEDFQGMLGSGQTDAFQTNDSGLMWFFSPNNLEVLVKVLDGCAINNRVWVFSAATTDVKYTLRVTDTVTNVTKTYQNPLGEAADAVTDTDAFEACE